MRRAWWCCSLCWLGVVASASAQGAGAPAEEAPPDVAPAEETGAESGPAEAGLASESATERTPATDPGAAGLPRRVGVMVLSVTSEDGELADGLGEVLLAAIASERPGLRTVGKEEIQAALTHDDAASLSCLASPACLGQLGVQLGLDELVAVSLGRREGGFAFDLGRYDPRTGERLAHAFREVDATEVGSLAEAMLVALVVSNAPPEPVVARVRLRVNPSTAVVWIDGSVVTGDEVELGEGAHSLRVEADGFVSVERTLELASGERRDVDVALAAVPPPPPPATPAEQAPSRIGAWIAYGSVGAAALGGGLALGFGLRSQRNVDEGISRAEAQGFVADRRRDARVANVGWAVAGLALAGAATGAVLAWRRHGRQSALRIGPLGGGAMVALEVRR